MNRIIVLFLSLWIASCSSSNSEQSAATSEAAKVTQAEKKSNVPELGTLSNPIRFYFTPSVSKDKIREKGGVLIDYLKEETGKEFTLHIPDNYEELIEAFGNNDAHLGIMSSLSYIKAHESYGVSAKLMAKRYNSYSYFGQIIANAGSGIQSVKDIQGKRFAYTDSSSGSGYLFPKKMLEEAGVTPAKVAFLGKHDEVVRKVYAGTYDAGATFHSEKTDGVIRDARAVLLEEYPDVEQKVKIIKVTEPIPNDPLVFNDELSSKLQFELSLAIIKFMTTDAGKNSLGELYSIQGYTKCADSSYDGLREALN